MLKGPPGPGKATLQIESNTFSWCSQADALNYIRQAIAGEMEGNIAIPVVRTIHTPAEHGRRPLCA